MKTLKQLERLQKIHQLVKMSSTGTPGELSGKLGISESQWYNILDDLKAIGFPIVYCKRSKTYYYREFCDLDINYSVELLTEQDKITIAGGRKGMMEYYAKKKSAIHYLLSY